LLQCQATAKLEFRGRDVTICDWVNCHNTSTLHETGVFGKGIAGNGTYEQQELVFVIGLISALFVCFLGRSPT
jgi:hypothetical protein